MKKLLTLALIAAAVFCKAQPEQIEKASFDALNMIIVEDKDGAAAIISRAIAQYPDAAALYNLRASLSMQTNPNAAQADLDKSISISAADSYTLLGKATAYTMKGDQESARKIWIQITSQAPKNPYDYIARSSAYRFLGESEAALADALKASELMPDSPTALFGYLGISAALGKDEEALEIARKLVRMLPDSPLALSMAGSLEFKMQNYNEAYACFEKIASKYPKALNMARMAAVMKTMAEQHADE